MKEKLSNEALEVRRAYQRAWRKKNPEKVRQHNERYWEKKAAAAKAVEDRADGETCL